VFTVGRGGGSVTLTAVFRRQIAQAR
jgi:hypothetical protein